MAISDCVTSVRSTRVNGLKRGYAEVGLKRGYAEDGLMVSWSFEVLEYCNSGESQADECRKQWTCMDTVV